MKYDEQIHESWLKTCREIDQMISECKKGVHSPLRLTIIDLQRMREEAFRKVEESTVDHVIEVHRLKQELNLTTRYV